ncbi:hypothetical protein QS413_12820 [Staphylococcus pseudintermedius]|uniref:hypothetical protein n=1 Tax=Staphylococcus pseudintermedius TaxID=283734 RepID=UPI00286E818A|nr:hypothetical protein [Staphylococcus pseudintermedius]WMZ50343.1 hypothetical protein QS413_12820 [Staphylococcus pseudintermedius]
MSTKPNVPVTVPQTGDTTIPPGSQYEIPTGGVPEGWTAEVDPPVRFYEHVILNFE